MTEQHFDIVIIGAGPGGYSTALRAAQLGKTVALIERDKTLGGTCLNRGCIPSKALLTAAHSAQNIRQAERMGISATLQSIDFGKLRDFRTSTVETMTKGLAGLLSHRGVTVFRGEAELRDVHDVHVAPAGGEAQVMRSFKAGVEEPVGSELTIKGEDIVLATGSRPLPLPGNPFSGALIDSTQALELDTFPSSAVIVGAGAVALEFASLWNAAGCEVTLLIRKDRVLSSWEKRASMTLTRELKRRGISVVTRASVDYVDTGANLGAPCITGKAAARRSAPHMVKWCLLLSDVYRTPMPAGSHPTASNWRNAVMFRPTRMGVRMWRAYGPWATSLRGMLWLIARLNRASPSPKPSQDLTPSRYPTKPCRKSCSLSLKRQASVLHSTMRNRVKPSSIRRKPHIPCCPTRVCS